MQNLRFHPRHRKEIYILKDSNLFQCILKFKFQKSCLRKIRLAYLDQQEHTIMTSVKRPNFRAGMERTTEDVMLEVF